MKLSEIQATLSELSVRPTKSLGQNFLHDQNLAGWIVESSALQPGEAWLEIGPGLGALTEAALARSSRGILIEKDDRLIAYLGRRFPGLQLIHGDASAFDVRELFAEGGVRVLGNLPYYVSSQILFNFTREPSPVLSMIFTLQRELAERLAAGPGSKNYGGPSLLIGRRWQVKYLRMLPASVFTPAPQVESAVVQLTPRPADELPDCDGPRFERLVKLGFSQRRKQLKKLVGAEIDDWPGAMRELGVAETVRGEELDLRQWIALTSFGKSGGSAEPLSSLAQDVHGELFDVVDEHNVVVRQASRHDVHRGGLRHRAVHIFIFDSAGELFLQRRSRWKDVHPLRWDSSAAGHLNAGDDYGPTAVRELEEELGVVTDLKLAGKVAACAETGEEFVQLYVGEHPGPFRLPPAEIECGGWFTPAQIDRWAQRRPEDFATGFLECWRVWREGRPVGSTA